MPAHKSLRQFLNTVRRQNRQFYRRDLHLSQLHPLEIPSGQQHYYDDASRFLEENRFFRLGDYRFSSKSQPTQTSHTPVRVFLSANGETVAAAFYFDIPLPQYLRLGLDHLPEPMTIDFTTEFVDRRYLATSNAEAEAIIELPKSIIRVILPASTAPRKILQTHRRELAKQKKLGRKPVRLASETDLIASIHRLHLLKCDYRKRIKYARVKEATALMRGEQETIAANAALAAQYDFGPQERAYLRQSRVKRKGS